MAAMTALIGTLRTCHHVGNIKRELLDLERREEELIVFTQEHGLDVTRRPMCDVRAILGVEVTTAASAAA
jgi:hypothetical protein